MPRPVSPPSYLKHRASNGKLYARTKLFGKFESLGPYGSKESHQRFEEIQTRWRAMVEAGGPGQDPRRCAVADLVGAFFKHIEEEGLYLRTDGTPTSERASFDYSLAPLLRLAGTKAVKDYTPMDLKVLQKAVISGSWLTTEEREARERQQRELCWSRGVTNQRVKRIVRVFGWGVSEGLVPVAVHQALLTVDSIPAGSKKAVDYPALEPVPDQDIRDTLPCLAPTFRMIALVQLATGMRPEEVCTMKKVEIDRRGLQIDGRPVWVYRPGGGDRHKTAHHGVKKAVALGPGARFILGLHLPEEGEWCFPGRRPGRHITVNGYSHAVLDAARAAGVPDWSPARLRKNAATELEDKVDLDTARATLGHTGKATTKRFYARADLKKAAKGAVKFG